MFPSSGNTPYSAKDISNFHTDVFTKFGIMLHSDQEQTTSTIHSKQDDMFMRVMLSYCNDDHDESCKEDIIKTRNMASNLINEQDPKSGRIRVTYPKYMDDDDDVRSRLDEVFSVLNMLEEENLQDVLEIMMDIELDIESMPHVSPLSKHMALSAVSVGMESAKTWHGASFNEKNALSGLCGPTLLLPIILPFVIGADMFGVLTYPIVFPALLPFIGFFGTCMFPGPDLVGLTGAAILAAPWASYFACGFVSVEGA